MPGVAALNRIPKAWRRPASGVGSGAMTLARSLSFIVFSE
jgi:hypothetical protein